MYRIGIDLGGTEIKGGLLNEEGEILHKVSVTTPVTDGFEGVCKRIAELVDELIKMAGLQRESVKSVGVGIPGLCDERGFVYIAVNLYWENVPLGERLRQIMGLPVYIENDATVAAIAEATKGSMKEVINGVLITLGTGVGGGLILQGRAYSGNHGLGSELGHMIIGENDYNCNCGSNGCLETFASATALVKYTKSLLKEGNFNSKLRHQLKDNLEDLNAKMIFDLAKEGDEIATKAVNRFIKYLAIGIGNIINLLDPEIIALGGGVSKAGSFLIESIEAEVGKYVFFKKGKRHCKIRLAELENDAGIIGAAMMGIKRED
ncbi:ROK family protein [Alkaliphilus transvaalensis]|uniref:ROK family protein n=1 Tax=Alkaliphilus transvaalensis TaxID=114628 RepID=UPI00047E2FDC|nr:ROK family glucokinase [Alkaliphilus transvaalensis]